MTIIDLVKERAARKPADFSIGRIDADGVEVFCYLGDYEFDGQLHGLEFWARDEDEARRKSEAIGNVKLRGRSYALVPS